MITAASIAAPVPLKLEIEYTSFIVARAEHATAHNNLMIQLNVELTNDRLYQRDNEAVFAETTSKVRADGTHVQHNPGIKQIL